eukprot:CAMPEP_0114521940 /NCGR_PEP_ID=MMETSP0109-20121206/20479_1 /TAXON_ID=29199 /ORGANISM="Chlorarachnion reptans, Strain CCCM449" /LENGTH=1665 /DNA_ID=CAMNT_0001703129 /DNA_START=319 /DNA_END=5316 /DNA_ORIENTATION=+
MEVEDDGEVAATQEVRPDPGDEEEEQEDFDGAEDFENEEVTTAKEVIEKKDDDDDDDIVTKKSSSKRVKVENDEENEEEKKEDDDDDEEEEEEEAEGAKSKVDKSKFIEDSAEVSGDDVEEDEEVESENEEDQEEPQKRKHRRLKRMREDELAEDDYDLVEEATGKKIQRNIDGDIHEEDLEEDEGESRRKLKRLRKAKKNRVQDDKLRAASMEELEEKMESGEDDDQEFDRGQKPEEKRRDDEEIYDDDDEFGDFIEGGYKTGGENMMKLQNMFGEYVKDFLVGVNPDDEVKYATEDNLKDIIDPTERDVKYIEKSDDEIRTKDIPERLQERMRMRISQAMPSSNDLAEEAKWILENGFNGDVTQFKVGADGKSNNIDNDLAETKARKAIKTVLELIKVYHYEIPVIAQTRREYCDVQEDILWRIDEWDEKWDQLYARRRKLTRRLEEEQGTFEELKEMVANTADPQELNDVNDYLTVMSQDDPSFSKAPRKLKIARLVRDDGFDELVKEMSLTGAQLAENIKLEYPKILPDLSEDSKEQRIAELPEERAIPYINSKFPTADSVLERVRTIAGYRISSHPLIRSFVRSYYFGRAYIHTKPTLKGLRKIDWMHPYWPVHRLVGKSVKDFTDASFVLAAKAEREGMINIRVDIPGSVVGKKHDGVPSSDILLDKISELFYDTTKNENKAWNNQRRLLLWEMISKRLHRLGVEHVKRELLRKAQERVADGAARRMRFLLGSGKIRGDNRNVVTCAVGERSKPSVCVALSEDGELVDHLELQFFKSRTSMKKSGGQGGRDLYRKKMADVERFVQFVEKHKPCMILIAADSLDCRSLKREIDESLYDQSVQTHFVDPEVARVFARSERSKDDFKELDIEIRMCISLGRWVQDPVSELCALYVRDSQTKRFGVLSLALHPLQNDIPSSSLMPKIMREYVRAVCYFGVDVNDIMRHPHKQHTLQFIAGLGPRKAHKLFLSLRKKSQIYSRKDLLEDDEEQRRNYEDEEEEEHRDVGGLGRNVYHNAAPFLRIIIRRDYHDHDEEKREYNPLDKTRIHPEDYKLAHSIIRNVYTDDDEDEDEDEDEEDKKATADQIEILSDPVGTRGSREEKKARAKEHQKRLAVLDSLDLEQYAEMLASESTEHYRLKAKRLQLIKHELKQPFADSKPERAHPLFGYRGRRDLNEPNAVELFFLLTGESPESLKIGMRVTTRVLHTQIPRGYEQGGTRPPRIVTLLDSGVRGYVNYLDVSDSAPWGAASTPQDHLKFLNKYQRDVVLPARVTGIRYTEFAVDLASKESSLNDAKAHERVWEVVLSTGVDSHVEPSLGAEKSDTLCFGATVKAFEEDRVGGRHWIHHALGWSLARVEGEEYMRRVDILDKDLNQNGPTADEKKLLQEARGNQKKRKFKARHINHPSFMNIDAKQAEEFLKKNTHTSNVFRPHSRDPNRITLTVKFGDQYLHYEIEERNKSNKLSLGQVLVLENRKYEDLDQIEASFISELINNLEALVSHNKFLETDAGHPTALQDKLTEEKRSNPGRIPYGLAFSPKRKHAGYFILGYILNKHYRFKYVKIGPSGFGYEGKTFTSVKKLLRYFKKTAMTPGTRVKREHKKLNVGWVSGDRVSARFHQDGQWYPALVINAPSKYHKGIGFVDVQFQGYPEYHPLAPEDIRKL